MRKELSGRPDTQYLRSEEKAREERCGAARNYFQRATMRSSVKITIGIISSIA
jgi:hypothetical protein